MDATSDKDDEPEMTSEISESEANSSESSAGESSGVDSGSDNNVADGDKVIRSSSLEMKKKKKTKNKQKKKMKNVNRSAFVTDSHPVTSAQGRELFNESDSPQRNKDSSDWLGGDESGDENKWTGYRTFKSQAVSSASVPAADISTKLYLAPSLLKKRKVANSDDDENWDDDAAGALPAASTVIGLNPSSSRRKILRTDDSDEE